MDFVKEAGKIIVAISIVLWFLASFPGVDQQEYDQNAYEGETIESYQLRNSFAGKFGQIIEPTIETLGFRLENRNRITHLFCSS